MLELTLDNLEAYLLAAGRSTGPVEIAQLAGGVSNVVFRVRTATESCVVKQSRPRLRTRDAWFSDVARIHRELEVMQALENALPAETVPRVLWEDRDQFVFAMSHAPAPASPWKDALLAGIVDPERGAQAGRVLGRIHEFSASRPDEFSRFADSKVFVQLRVDPFYVRVQERCPDVADAIAPLIRDMLETKLALCHGDFTPKNLLLHEAGFTLVDYETAYFGDPAMDLGLLQSHLTLKRIRRPDQADRYRELSRRFRAAYAAEIRSLPLEEIQARGLRHLGACLLARVDGTSPVDYLPEDKREQVRNLARGILFGEVRDWDREEL